MNPGLVTLSWWKRMPPIVCGVVALATSGVDAADSFEWSTKARCPLGRFEAMGGAAAGELYQFSGFNTVDPILATTRCDAYNPASNTWRSITSIPQATTHAGQVPDTDQPANQTFFR